MNYNFVADSFHTKKLCGRLFSSEVRFYTENGRFAFLSPPFGGLGATYDDHIRLIGKQVVCFLLVLIELSFARCYGWGATSQYRLKIGDFAPTGAGRSKISGSRPPPTNHSSSQKTKLSDVSYSIKIWTVDRSFFRFVTMHACDGQILIARLRLYSMQRRNN